MKKYILCIGVALVAASCNKQFDDAMKSADKDLIIKVADDMYAKKKWKQVLSLYEHVQNLVSGSEEASDILFKSAYANYYDKQYRLAGHQFKQFAINDGLADDPRREEAAYMSAICYYQGSLDYNLDQTSTRLAITELQNFLNTYPNSDRAKNIRNLIDELEYKLEYKAFQNAKQYYKMLEYKSAIINFNNMLDDFPATKLRSKAENYLLNAKAQLALNSKFDLKGDRLQDAIAYTKYVEKKYPDSNMSKDALALRDELNAAYEKYTKLKQQIDTDKADYDKKMKEKEEQKENKDNS